MTDDGVNHSRRRFLTGATAVVGGAGVVGAAVPFVSSWQPSAKAKAAGAPVKVNISKLESGGRLVVEWRASLYIVRRTEESRQQSNSLTQHPPRPRLRGCIPARLCRWCCAHPGRARGVPGSGRSLYTPRLRTDVPPRCGCPDLGGDSWLGGFFCPCHGSKFDLSGRVYAGVPAPTNLEIPPHSYESDDILIIGIDPEVA